MVKVHLYMNNMFNFFTMKIAVKITLLSLLAMALSTSFIIIIILHIKSAQKKTLELQRIHVLEMLHEYTLANNNNRISAQQIFDENSSLSWMASQAYSIPSDSLGMLFNISYSQPGNEVITETIMQEESKYYYQLRIRTVNSFVEKVIINKTK